MVAIVVCSHRVDDRPGPQLWAAEEVCLTALTRFAAGNRIVFAWDGPSEPAAVLEGVEVVELPRYLSLWQARQWVLREVLDIDEQPVMLVDRDALVGPDTLDLLLEDWRLVNEQSDVAPGLVVSRSNHAPPAQDIRMGRGSTYLGGGRGFASENDIAARTVVEVNAALIAAPVLDAISPPWFDEMSDEVVAIDLGRAGFVNVVSRAYVHRHPRERRMLGGVDDASLTPDGVDFLRFARPDVIELIEAPSAPAPPPELSLESQWPDEAYRRWRVQPESRSRTIGMARCLRWLGRSIDAAQLMTTFDPASFSDDELEFAADLARLVGDLDTALALYASRPERFGQSERELSELIARYEAMLDDAR